MEIPRWQIAVGGKKNGSRDIRLYVSGQHDFLRGRGTLRRDHGNSWHRQGSGFGAKRGAGVHSLKNSGNQQPAENGERDDSREPTPSRRRVLAGERRVMPVPSGSLVVLTVIA